MLFLNLNKELPKLINQKTFFVRNILFFNHFKSYFSGPHTVYLTTKWLYLFDYSHDWILLRNKIAYNPKNCKLVLTIKTFYLIYLQLLHVWCWRVLICYIIRLYIKQYVVYHDCLYRVWRVNIISKEFRNLEFNFVHLHVLNFESG